MNHPPFTTRKINNIHIIELNGRFDANITPRVKAWLTTQLDNGANKILINLSGVNFIDTRAISILVTGLKKCTQVGGDLRICALQQPVQIIFEMTHLNRIFTTYSNEESAIDSFEESVAEEN